MWVSVGVCVCVSARVQAREKKLRQTFHTLHFQSPASFLLLWFPCSPDPASGAGKPSSGSEAQRCRPIGKKTADESYELGCLTCDRSWNEPGPSPNLGPSPKSGAQCLDLTTKENYP